MTDHNITGHAVLTQSRPFVSLSLPPPPQVPQHLEVHDPAGGAARVPGGLQGGHGARRGGIVRVQQQSPQCTLRKEGLGGGGRKLSLSFRLWRAASGCRACSRSDDYMYQIILIPVIINIVTGSRNKRVQGSILHCLLSLGWHHRPWQRRAHPHRVPHARWWHHPHGRPPHHAHRRPLLHMLRGEPHRRGH